VAILAEKTRRKRAGVLSVLDLNPPRAARVYALAYVAA
jgi:hypothetical protein